ncbi:MAG: hypothetical protein ABID83_01100 [Candidatus Omnitrophota bacterium]
MQGRSSSDDIVNNSDLILAEIKKLVIDNMQNPDDMIGNLDVTIKKFEEFNGDVKEHPRKLLFKGE